MEVLGCYILSVTSAAILFSILHSMLDKKSSSAVLLQLIGGLFLTFTIISPVADIKFDSLFDFPPDYISQGNLLSAQGRKTTQDQLREIIKQRSEAYILDKAMSYQTPIHVEVSLRQDETPVPTAVRLQGSITPYAKSAMQQRLQDEIGIPRENQIWTD